MPKPAAVTKYKRWRDVRTALTNPEVRVRDFVLPSEQIRSDYDWLISTLNNLWEVVIPPLETALYRKENSRLRERFGLEFVEEQVAEKKQGLMRVFRQLSAAKTSASSVSSE
jgi:hypothetical protein